MSLRPRRGAAYVPAYQAIATMLPSAPPPLAKLALIFKSTGKVPDSRRADIEGEARHPLSPRSLHFF